MSLPMWERGLKLDTDGINRLKSYSAKLHNGKVNQLYGTSADCSDIDTGFLMSKTVKHAFKGYPKLSLGVGGVMESEKDEQPEPTTENDKAQEAAFGDKQEEKQGVTVATSGDDPF